MFVNKCVILLAVLLTDVTGLTQSVNIDIRIAGGHSIDITEAPYQVSVLKRGRHICGGTIVGKNIIITAAHCVVKSKVTDFYIRAGSNSKGGQVIPVDDLIWHQNFNYTYKDSDIAILWLRYPLKGNNAVRSVMMIDDGEEIPDGSIISVTGWGLTSEGGSIPSTLQRIEIPIVNEQVCSAIFRTSKGISSRRLCAGYAKGGKGTCKGDSGGPMIYNKKLAGVVSGSLGCARPYIPGVFTKVSALRKWLDYNISLLIHKHSNSIYTDYYY